MPDPARLLTTLQKAVEAFRATAGRQGKLLELQDGGEVIAAGDLHGNVQNFSRLLKAASLQAFPRRHLIVQEVIHGSSRYANGSDKSHQLLDLLAALKCQFPQRVHFLLGNHELSQWTDREIGKGHESCNELFRAGIATAYGHHAEAVYTAYTKLFSATALAIRTPNRVFLSHSIPQQKQLSSFDTAVLCNEALTKDDVGLGGTAHSLVWGRDSRAETVRAFLDKVDADFVINGHMPCENGFATPNDRQLLLDTGAAPACYCLLPMERPLRFDDIVAGVCTL